MRRLIRFLLLVSFAIAQASTGICTAGTDAASGYAHHAPPAAYANAGPHRDAAAHAHDGTHGTAAAHAHGASSQREGAAAGFGDADTPSHDTDCANVSRCHSVALPMQQRRATPVAAAHGEHAPRAPTRIAASLPEPNTPPPKPIA